MNERFELGDQTHVEFSCLPHTSNLVRAERGACRWDSDETVRLDGYAYTRLCLDRWVVRRTDRVLRAPTLWIFARRAPGHVQRGRRRSVPRPPPQLPELGTHGATTDRSVKKLTKNPEAKQRYDYCTTNEYWPLSYLTCIMGYSHS